MPQRVQFIKLNTTVALCSSCSTGQWQLLPCSRMLYISLFLFLPFLLFLSLSSLCSLLSAIVCMSFRIPYPVCRYATMPYAAVSRFLIYAIPCMCHISAAKHTPHACGAWLQQKYHKKCHKCSTWNMWHAARTVLRLFSLNLQQQQQQPRCRCEAALDKPQQAVAHNSCHLPLAQLLLATAMKWQLAAAPCFVARQKPLCKRKHQIVN